MDCDFLILKNPLQPKKVERMSKKLNKLSHNEHFLIDILFNQERKSISEIAKILQRSKSVISCELKRNAFDGYYNHKTAQAKTIERR